MNTDPGKIYVTVSQPTLQECHAVAEATFAYRRGMGIPDLTRGNSYQSIEDHLDGLAESVDRVRGAVRHPERDQR